MLWSLASHFLGRLTPEKAAALLLVDVVFCAIIVWKVAYTEIDWKAYMEEVEGFLGGERDYTQIRGSTGPLVYPAGFLYIFTILRYLTSAGKNTFLAQVLFVGVYLLTLMVVLALYIICGAHTLSAVLLLLSKRVHSIYMLRMFNDCVAVLCGYLAVLLFGHDQYRLGCLVYSLGVGVKMNMLLYAPGVLLVLLVSTGWVETALCLGICAGLQLLLGFPFLTSYPVQYLSKAFELDRVFMHKWTVNFKFLTEEVFVGRPLSHLLLGLTALGFGLFARKWILELQAQCRAAQSTAQKATSIIGIGQLNARFIAVTIFTSNFIGIAFARTLHYQFYCWYFHTLPFLLFTHALPGTSTGKGSTSIGTGTDADIDTGWGTDTGIDWMARLVVVLKVLVLAGIEVAFNVYPATTWSSVLLQVCHFFVLLALYITPVPIAAADANSDYFDESPSISPASPPSPGRYRLRSAKKYM
ncbi:ALG3 protein-domain-containing protein [Ochromonadaceae sp. CCMP2298]|nr:ALG3 protein-domain-containing protein [Ochromonadaceae sp. CCMP2298]